MKRVCIRICTLLICIISFVSCKTIDKNEDMFEQRFDENENYTGFSDLSSGYKLEDAKNDGYYTELDSIVYANYNVWEEFIDTSSKGENAFIRIVNFYSEDSNSPYFLDLYYNDGYYYLLDSSAENLNKEKFSFLLTLEGKSGNPLRDTNITILTNNNMLTFDEFTKAMFSSDFEVVQSIEPYKVLMFK